MSAPAFGRPLAGGSPLQRRNPSVKLGVLLVVSAALIAVFDPWTPLVLYCLAVPAVLLGARVPWRMLTAAHVPFALFATSLLIVNAVSRPGDVIAVAGPLEVTAEGLSIGASLALRTLLVGTLSVGFVLSTDGARLMISLHQHCRLGPRPTYAILAGYRLLEQLPEQWQTVRRAQAARTARPIGDRVALPRSPRALLRAAFATLVTTLRRGERMSIALESRGLGSGPRTVFRPVPLGGWDAVFAVGVFAVLAAILLLSRRAGWLAGWGSLGVFG